jgi:hypothetical protein
VCRQNARIDRAIALRGAKPIERLIAIDRALLDRAGADDQGGKLGYAPSAKSPSLQPNCHAAPLDTLTAMSRRIT